MLNEANLALLVGARLRVINALPLPCRDKGHHPGGRNDAWVVEDTAGLVMGNSAAMVADAELCTEHVRGNRRSCMRNNMIECDSPGKGREWKSEAGGTEGKEKASSSSKTATATYRLYRQHRAFSRDSMSIVKHVATRPHNQLTLRGVDLVFVNQHKEISMQPRSKSASSRGKRALTQQPDRTGICQHTS